MDNTNGSVKDPADFFGRAGIIRKIFSRIGAERPQSIALIGSRKSGKTSILNMIMNTTVRAENLEHPEQFLFFLLDSRECTEGHADMFIRQLVHFIAPHVAPQVAPHVGSQQEESGDNSYNALQIAVKKLHGQDAKLILLFDDFHFITGSGKYPLEFFSFLRSLANNYNVAYITTSYLELQKLCIAKDIEESPFFNIFTNISIGPFTPEEGRAFLAHRTGMEESAAGKISAWAGETPYGLTLIAQHLPDDKYRNITGTAAFEKELMPILAPYFSQILSLLSKEAFRPLSQLAKDRQPDEQDEYHLRPLIRHGYLVEENDRVRAFSPAFQYFLKNLLTVKILRGREFYSGN